MIADEYEEESAGLDDLDAASDEEEEDGKTAASDQAQSNLDSTCEVTTSAV